MSDHATVELVRVTKRYRGITALDAVDLSLRPGITGLLGPERRRQDDAAADPRHGARPRSRRGAAARP